MRPARRLRRALVFPFAVAAALWIFAEEFLWRNVDRALAALGRLPVLRAIEGAIARAPAWAAVPMFIVPAVVLLPFKIAALWLIAHGHYLVGLQTFVLAKIVGTALAARIFALCKPTLMALPWFARAHDRVLAWRDAIVARVTDTVGWRWARRHMHALRMRVRAWRARRGGGLLRRFRAMVALRRSRSDH